MQTRQEYSKYTEEGKNTQNCGKKIFMTPDNHESGVITRDDVLEM